MPSKESKRPQKETQPETPSNVFIISKKKALVLLLLCGLLVILCVLSIAMLINNPFDETTASQDFGQWEEMTYLEKPILNFIDGQTILLEDFEISWANCLAADYYKYNIILLDGEPEYGNDNESEKAGSIILAQNKEGTTETSVPISKDLLVPGKWIKIAVASCQSDFELWNSVYIHIKKLIKGEKMEKKEWVKPLKIELPIEKNPPVKSYLHHAFPLSVMYTDDRYKMFYYMNFIQLVYNPSSGCAYDFHEFQYRHLHYFYSDRLDDSMTKHIHCDINEFISMQIVNRYYCAAWVDAFYIPDELFYKQRHITHGILIYQYDDEKREYQALAYTNKNSTYQTITVPYDCFTKAFQSDFFAMLDFFKLNFGMLPKFNEEIARKKLQAYLHSEDYDLDDNKNTPKKDATLYGKNVCYSLRDYIAECSTNKSVIDLRYITIFTEHKKSILETLKLFEPNENIIEFEKCYTQMKRLCEKLLILAIRYNSHMDPLYSKQLLSTFDTILLSENNLLNLFNIK